MIGEYTLLELCKKYDVDATKIVKKNNNILSKGEYFDIDKTLDYLINKLNISTNNIEKCPSILYRNVDSIKSNIYFLKAKNINFSSIESCLHVLSSEPNELIKTYDYVKNNYGVSAIDRNTSILSVNVDIITEVEKLKLPISRFGNLTIAVSIHWGSTSIGEVKKIIQSEEFKTHPEMFTSTTLAHAKLEEIQKIIQSEEYKAHPELFTSQTLAHAKLEEIQKIIQSPEFKAYPELFTSETLSHAKLEEIQKIIQSPEFKVHPEIFTSTTLAHAKLEEIQKIIQSPEFKTHPELFTSETLAHAKLEEVQELLKMDYWNDDRFKNLLTSSIVAKSKSMLIKLPILIDMAEKYQIDNFLNTSFLLFSPSQNYALIQYLNEKNKPLIIEGKLNPILGKQPGVLKKKYDIDLKELMKKYPMPENMKEGIKIK